MGNRLSKIYTRTGDSGTTRLADGEQVAKFDPRIIAGGDVDELNCALGLLHAEGGVPDDLRELVGAIQQSLFELGGEITMPEYQTIDEQSISFLEDALDRLNSELPPLTEFILPQGNRAVATCHMARAVCRRAERSLWLLADSGPIRTQLPRFLNRLSDFLFVVARSLAARSDLTETQWQHERR